MRFDLEALNWDEKPRRVKLAKAVVDFIKDDIVGKRVLDFGCGTGLVSLNFCGKADILGIDLSCEMVNIFNQKAKQLNCSAKAICDDIININDKFDIIVANMVFHHIKNIDEMLNILCDRLKNNGILVISDLGLEDGTFHDKGNDDVFHFGFEKDSFNHKCYKLLHFDKIFTINKHKDFDVFIWKLKKML